MMVNSQDDQNQLAIDIFYEFEVLVLKEKYQLHNIKAMRTKICEKVQPSLQTIINEEKKKTRPRT